MSSAHRSSFGRNTWGNRPMSHPSDLASPEQLLIASLPVLNACCPWQYRLPAVERPTLPSSIGRLLCLASALVPAILGNDDPRLSLLLVWPLGSHECTAHQPVWDWLGSLPSSFLGNSWRFPRSGPRSAQSVFAAMDQKHRDCGFLLRAGWPCPLQLSCPSLLFCK